MSEQKSGTPQRPPENRAALIGLAVIVLLVAGGLFLVHVLNAASQMQDCVMSGRTNCAPVDTSTLGK